TQDLAGTGLGQSLDRHHRLEGGDRANLFAHELYHLTLDLFRRTVDTGVEHDEASRDLAFHLVGHAYNGAFGHVPVLGDDLLHLSRRQAVSGNIDDVVRARHHIDVAIGVNVACVGGRVVAREIGEVARAEALVVVP